MQNSSTPASVRRVLIVDDMRDGADSLALVLRSLGHEVDVAYGGEQALAMCAQERFEVILLDIGMPVVDGLEVCRRLRVEPWGRDVCVVALTGWSQQHDRQRTHEAGFDHHLVKPADLDALAAILAQPKRVRSAPETSARTLAGCP
jgi:CheY-like chemotaxis protein